MTELIRQRLDNDCTLCCISMATGISWERVFVTALMMHRGGYRPWCGTLSALQVCGALDVSARSFLIAAEFGNDGLGLKQFLWGRRAILSVESLNDFDGDHDVYWDGGHVLDPSLKDTYPDDLNALTPSGLLIFDERQPLAKPT